MPILPARLHHLTWACSVGASLQACLLTCLTACLLTACDGSGQSSATAGTDIPGSTRQLEASVGDVTVYITAIQTSSIPAQVAREHGIVQRDGLVMLRVSPRRQGSNREIVSAPVEVQATATTLGAAPQNLPLKQMATNGLVDYVGTVEVQLPQTVSFDVSVATPSGARETLSVTGDFSTRL